MSLVESGGKTDFQYGNQPTSLHPPAKVDRMLHDGEEVKPGGTTLVAHLTPGHTKGCTTWTMKVAEAGKIHDVVIIGSPNVNEGYKLVTNSSDEVRAAERRGRNSFHRSSGLQEIHNRQGEGFPDGAGEAEGSSPSGAPPG